MNLQQLRIIRAAIRCRFNLTEAAGALFTSQSGLSKHIKDLEDELGVEIFVRRGKRLTGLTKPGAELAQIVERILLDTSNIKRLAQQYAGRESGQLVIATTHTQARYKLPPLVAQFRQAFPKVHLHLHQGSPEEIAALLLADEADIAIATESIARAPELATFPFYSWHHALIVPTGHALAKSKKLTLKQIAQYPLITYHEGFTGRAAIDQAFAKADLAPDIVMSALDADVIKSYVELGLGLGIIAAMAFDERRDAAFAFLPCEHLFPTNTTLIAVRRGRFLADYACRFIALCAPSLTEPEIRQACNQPREA